MIILNNAVFYLKSVLPYLAIKYECQVLFLPPYSPDLTIEKIDMTQIIITVKSIDHDKKTIIYIQLNLT